MPPLSLAKSRKQHPGCIQEDRDQTCLGFSCKFHSSYFFFISQLEFLFAAITPPGTDDDNWPLCMLDVRLMAKETIRHCSGEEKHAMGDCIRGNNAFIHHSRILSEHQY